jgi:hypothetical protein
MENDFFRGRPRYEGIIAALQEQRPETDEAANLIVEEVSKRGLTFAPGDLEFDEEADRDAEEAELILDGAPPALPPPTAPQPQKLGVNTEWAGTGMFEDAVNTLLGLRTKPAARFGGIFDPADLGELASFLSAVAAADRKNEAA